MNEHFICIKVDREERPDLDDIYMTAVQAMTGRGGWPLTVFLTPELKPFYGGTYFPPEDRYGMPGFPRILESIADAWENRRDEVVQGADAFMEDLRKMQQTATRASKVSLDIIESAVRDKVSRFDKGHGGFGGAPKFPDAMGLELLLRYHHRTGDEKVLKIVTQTLRAMALGGMYDQLGGGFHRYSVDAEWRVPHFEKMLYDNAQLAAVYTDAYLATGDELFARISRETLDYVLREMTSPEGGFYATQDADSEGEEGKFFVWTPAEIREVLGDELGNLACRYYDVTTRGSFEHGTSTLAVHQSVEDLARELKRPADDVRAELQTARRKLFAAREKRVHPARDEKIIVAWNGLMMSALAKAGRAFDEVRYRRAAEKAARFILEKVVRDGVLYHSYKDGKLSHPGFLDDYACLVNGLIDLYQADFSLEWLQRARQLTDALLDRFWEGEDQGFFYTKKDDGTVLRTRNAWDNAVPSGNSVATMALLRLSILLGENRYRDVAEANLKLNYESIKRTPAGFSAMLNAVDFYLGEPPEIAIVGGKDPETKVLIQTVNRLYLPNSVVVLRTDDTPEQAVGLIPLLEGRTKVDGHAAAYVCRNFTCQAPVTDPASLRAALQR